MAILKILKKIKIEVRKQPYFAT